MRGFCVVEGSPSISDASREILRLGFIPLRFASLHSASLRMTSLAIVAVAMIFTSSGFAQERRAPVDYYRSPYGWAVQADPLGYILGRYGGRLEMRTEPNYSLYLDFAHDRDIDTNKSSITDDAIPMNSLGVGGRIYLRDNGALEGLFAGGSLAGTLQSGSRLGLRLSVEIGYKLVFGDGPFFIEPQLLIDSYPFRHPAAKPMFSYISIPLGFAWK
jgi:hypothetical protein